MSRVGEISRPATLSVVCLIDKRCVQSSACVLASHHSFIDYFFIRSWKAVISSSLDSALVLRRSLNVR